MYKMTMLSGLLVAIMGVSAFGAGMIGTPTAELEQGQWNVGFNYMYSDMELDKTKITESWSSLIEVEGFPDHKDSDTGSYKLEIDDVKTQRYYGTIGYGLTNTWEVYVQLGIADLKSKVKEEGESEWNGLNFDNDFAWGWGTRYTFYEQGDIRWGASVQMNWIDTSWEEKSTGELVVGLDPGELFVAESQEKTQIDWSTYDLFIAVGPTVDMGGWNLYGGPFYYMQKGDFDLKRTETATDGAVIDFNNFPILDIYPASGTRTVKESGDLEADGIGVFVGAQMTLMEKFSMTTEIAFTGDGWAIGAGVAMPF